MAIVLLFLNDVFGIAKRIIDFPFEAAGHSVVLTFARMRRDIF